MFVCCLTLSVNDRFSRKTQAISHTLGATPHPLSKLLLQMGAGDTRGKKKKKNLQKSCISKFKTEVSRNGQKCLQSVCVHGKMPNYAFVLRVDLQIHMSHIKQTISFTWENLTFYRPSLPVFGQKQYQFIHKSHPNCYFPKYGHTQGNLLYHLKEKKASWNLLLKTII